MKRLIPATVLALLAGMVIGAAPTPPTPPATTPTTRMGLDGRPADTRPIMEPYTNAGNWVTRHNGFVDTAKKGNIDLVLLGDSITDGWNNTGRAVWQKEFPNSAKKSVLPSPKLSAS
jgi:hypothetical protein